MDTVFVLQHEHDDDVKFIGVYRTESAARAAIERLRLQPGFNSYPDGFYIDEYPLDEDNWTEGFISSEEALRSLEEGK